MSRGGVRNTTAATHSDGATITNTTDYVGWGEAASGDKVFDPGMWSLDNYGATLIALILMDLVFNGIQQRLQQRQREQPLFLMHPQRQETC